MTDLNNFIKHIINKLQTTVGNKEKRILEDRKCALKVKN